MRGIEYCREVLARSQSSFAPAIRVLPRVQRDAMTAFYAFCREVDDDVDEAPSESVARENMVLWRRRIAEVFSKSGAEEAGSSGDRHPIVSALRDVAARFPLRRSDLELIVEGCERDLGTVRVADFAELYAYCYRVASAVGLVTVSILGRRDPRVELYAELSGVAVQLVNVIRDVAEDAERGRVYLPADELATFGVSESDLLERRDSPELRAYLRFLGARAAHYHGLARAALAPRERGELFLAEALRTTYERLLDQLDAADYAVMERRVSLSGAQKVGIALRHRLNPIGLAASARAAIGEISR